MQAPAESGMTKETLTLADEQAMFHLHHSCAFVQFAALEQQLANMVTIWAYPPFSGTLYNSFYGIDTFRSKLEYIDRFMLN